MGDKQPARMSAEEKRLIRGMHFDQKLPPMEISTVVNRGLSSIVKLLAQKKAPRPIGRPEEFTEDRRDATRFISFGGHKPTEVYN